MYYCDIIVNNALNLLIAKIDLKRAWALTLSSTGNIAENWLQWKENFINYLKVNNYVAKSDDLKIYLLKKNIGKIGQEAIEILCKDSKKSINNMNTLLEELDTYFQISKNEIIERYNFFTTSQREDQSIDAYILVLKEKAETCNFGTLTDSLIRDKVVASIKDKNLETKLLNTDKLDLLKLMIICHKHNNDVQTKITAPKNLNNEIVTKQKQQTKKYPETKNTNIIDKLITDKNCQITTVFRKQCWKCRTYHPMHFCPAW
nr:uncharacterized protein LOC116431217 isoform X2 [Nomia melanderi]